jgi:alanine dehydrogenase
MIVKVKEPQLEECALLKENQILFTYLHLAPDPDQAKALINSGARAIAYESVQAHDGSYPLLTPMSEVAGRMAIQAGASCLEKAKGGRGLLIGGVTNVEAANVVVIGGGVVGINSIEIAIGMQANVTVLDKSAARLDYLESIFGDKLNAVIANSENNKDCIKTADLVIGAVLVPGASAPKIITRDLVKLMKPGSVIVDVAIDQGGCSETSHATTHSDPTYVEEGVLHYCVANMPGAVPLTSTYALNQATMPYVLSLANNGFSQALLNDKGFCEGLNICNGEVTIEAVAKEQRYNYITPMEMVNRISSDQ